MERNCHKSLGLYFMILLNMAVSINGAEFNEICGPLPANPCNASRFLKCDQFNPFDEGTCTCLDGMLPRINIGGEPMFECLSMAGYPCDINSTCNDESTCQNGVCTCPPNLYPNRRGFCVGNLNSTCLYNEDCWDEKGLSCSADGTCQCNDDTHVWSELREKCTRGVGTVPATCQNGNDDDCVDNAECINGFCTCQPGYIIDRLTHGAGVCSLAYNGYCPYTFQRCSAEHELTCLPDIEGHPFCSCTEGTHLSSDRTRCQIKAGSSLTCGGNPWTLYQCTDNGYCHPEARKCVCLQNTYQRLDGRCDLRPGDPGTYGRLCLTDFNCDSIDFLLCNKTQPGNPYGFCRCDGSKGLVWDGFSCALTQANEHGQRNCDFIKNCGPNAKCIGRWCECDSGYYSFLENGIEKCLPRLPNGLCSTLENDCHPESHLVCETGRCRCPIGSKWLQNENQCGLELGASCTIESSIRCRFGYCGPFGYCQCSTYDVADFIDLENPELGKNCKGVFGTNCEYQECSQSLDLICKSVNETKICGCEDNHAWDPVQGKCVSVPGGYCGIRPDVNPPRNISCPTFSLGCQLDNFSGLFKCGPCDLNISNFDNSTGLCVEIEFDKDNSGFILKSSFNIFTFLAVFLGFSYMSVI